ncbi:MAG: cupin domain-containing protein [Vicinamibacteria bacterium]
MTERRDFLMALAGVMAAARGAGAFEAPAGAAQAQTSSRMVVQRDMPAVNLDGWRVTAVEVTYPPGAGGGPHRHPGFVVGYVLRGQYRFAVNNEPPRVVPAGEMFFESPGDTHAVSANASDTEPTTILAMVFTPKDQPVTLPG